jgi:hypothetical protein
MNYMKHDRRNLPGAAAMLGLSLLVAGAALGQSAPGPGLVGPTLTYAGEIERAAARSNDLVFRTLDPQCNPAGVLDPLPAPEFADISARRGTPGPLCNADTFHVYANARELTHTANELQGTGPTAASLGLDLDGLGRALRWTAAEELAAQGSMATEFANGQLATLAARLTALRFGAGGFGGVAFYDRLRRDSPLLAQAGNNPDADGGAVETYSPWGGFLNYGFGYGTKTPTLLEDAFDFDGSEVTLGVDYRLRNNVVLGAIVGLTRQDIDFDEAASAVSVVDGSIEGDGDGFMLFALSQGERLTISGSVGVQSLDHTVARHIQYPSFNENIPSTNSLARSEPQSDVETATFGLGYAFNWAKLTLEPYLDIEYIDLTIDPFAEERSIDRFSNSADTHRFDLAVSHQNVESLQTTIGLRFQYVVTPRFGVIVPFWSIALHRESEDHARTITTGYAALADVLGSSTFELPTDIPDDSYYTVAAGFSTVLRGGRQTRLDGRIAGGLSGFVQLAVVEERDTYEDQVVTMGVRYEF